MEVYEDGKKKGNQEENKGIKGEGGKKGEEGGKRGRNAIKIEGKKIPVLL